MGAFSRKADVTIPATPEQGAEWGWDPGETVTLKGKFTVDDMEATMSYGLESDGKTPKISSSNKNLMDSVIASWTLVDEQGRIAEKSVRTIGMLELNYFTPIMEAIDTIQKSGAKAKDPLSSSIIAAEPTLAS